jgi:hypothetical protein
VVSVLMALARLLLMYQRFLHYGGIAGSRRPRRLEARESAR